MNEVKKQIIRDQTLEHISHHFEKLGSGERLANLLNDWGVPETLIERTNTKWRMVFAVLKHYASSLNKKDHQKLFEIIAEILHPLMYNGDKKVADVACEDFNKYLEYDGIAAFYMDGAGKKYMVYETDTQGVTEEEVLEMMHEVLFEQEQDELQFLRLPKNREKISTLRKAYQIFINIVEVFCENPSKPSHELNNAYINTKKLIMDVVRDLKLRRNNKDGTPRVYTLTHYCIPFNNLFTAEVEYKDRSLENLHWDDIRPKMHAAYGSIDELYREVDGSDVLSEPDVQQTLNNVSLLLSKIKEEDKKVAEAKQKTLVPQTPVQKFEITAMPELQVRNVEDNKKTDFYITKKADDFYYKGRYLKLSKRSDYYKVFSALHAKLPDGGEISYKDLIVEVKSRFLYRMQNDTDDEMRKFIQRNLTDKSNGFVRYAGIPATEDNGKPLLEVARGSGIIFNNKMG